MVEEEDSGEEKDTCELLLSDWQDDRRTRRFICILSASPGCRFKSRPRYHSIYRYPARGRPCRQSARPVLGFPSLLWARKFVTDMGLELRRWRFALFVSSYPPVDPAGITRVVQIGCSAESLSKCGESHVGVCLHSQPSFTRLPGQPLLKSPSHGAARCNREPSLPSRPIRGKRPLTRQTEASNIQDRRGPRIRT